MGVRTLDNIKIWLERAVRDFGEPLEAVVVGIHYDHSWTQKEPNTDENVVLDPATALAKLDVDFYAGFGGANCYPIYAWTASRVFFISEYDGATDLHWVPRHPIAIAPSFSGESSL